MLMMKIKYQLEVFCVFLRLNVIFVSFTFWWNLDGIPLRRQILMKSNVFGTLTDFQSNIDETATFAFGGMALQV